MEQKITSETLQKKNITSLQIAEALMKSEMESIEKIDFKSTNNDNSDIIELFVKNQKIDKEAFILEIGALKIILTSYNLLKFFEKNLAMEIIATLGSIYFNMLKHVHPGYFENLTLDEFIKKIEETHWWFFDFLLLTPEQDKKNKFTLELYKSFCTKILGETYPNFLVSMAFEVMATAELIGTYDFCKSLSGDILK